MKTLLLISLSLLAVLCMTQNCEAGSTSSTGYHVEPNVLKIRMQVAYPLLGKLMGVRKIWAVYLVPPSFVRNIDPDQEIVATLECGSRRCLVKKVRLKTQFSKLDSGPMIFGRFSGSDEKSGNAILIFDPFPLSVSPRVFARLKFSDHRVKFIDVSYKNEPKILVFQDLRLVANVRGAPLTWK